jgi:hypothetical protein
MAIVRYTATPASWFKIMSARYDSRSGPNDPNTRTLLPLSLLLLLRLVAAGDCLSCDATGKVHVPNNVIAGEPCARNHPVRIGGDSIRSGLDKRFMDLSEGGVV